MKFKEFLIQESKDRHAVLAFGRLQPPTTGHEVLVNKVKEVAKQHNAEHHIVLSHSNDPKQNPLTPQQKVKHAKRFFPGTNITTSDKEAPNFLTQAAKLHKSGVTHLHMVAGSDRISEYKKVLNKYNGTHEGALFNFKKIEVHSAGQRDPDAEGTTGMSGSKMRAHAQTGKFKEFKKGVPGHVSDAHAKELYQDLRKGMNIKEDINKSFEGVLLEGLHDQGIFKAVFLAGGPGSGKDYVLSNTLEGQGLIEISSDKALEFLMDKKGLDKTMPATEKDKRDIVRTRAKSITELKQRLAIMGRNGLIVNGTGEDYEKISRIKEKLEDLGYESAMILVNTEDEISKQRNIERGQRGGRTVPEQVRKEKWQNVQNSRPEFAKLFGDKYMEFDNSQDLRNAPPEVVKAKKEELLQLYTNIQEFVAQPPQTEASQEWVATQMHAVDTLPIAKDGAEKTPHANSRAAQEAQKLGLQYYGFGRYGQNGEVTYRSVHDTLVKVVKTPTGKPMNKKVNEEFEDFLNEANNTKVFTKTKILKDKSGKVKTFMLRSTAASEAHKHGGKLAKVKNGYVIHLEAIDFGIEPGLSMAQSGESPARDTGEKISKKRFGKATQVYELTGDSTTMSIGDQKEDELKKVGISLQSFKAKKFVG
jgi:nicotinamide mononucleotide adenylyltransferase/predicted ABC-type ATPase